MNEAIPARRGRPRSMAPLSAAERMRRYRARLRERGLSRRVVLTEDPWLAGVRFGRDSLQTPAERDVLRRFCAGLSGLDVWPSRIAVFGSRARGGAHEDSDLDVAVFVDAEPGGQLESRLFDLAVRAQAPYAEGACTIRLRPVLLRERERSTLARTVRSEMEVVWTRQRSLTK
jgi:hypothetical protein